MKTPYLSYTFFLIVFLISSCQKDHLNGASGQVIDAATQKGVPNAQVILYLAQTSFIGPTLVSFLEEVTTDKQGYYTFDYDIQSPCKETYKTSVTAETYFEKNLNSFPRKKIVELDPEGYVKMHVKKVDSSYYSTVSINSVFVNGGSFFKRDTDTTFIHIRRGNKINHYTWFLYENYEPEPNILKDSIFIPNHDTVYFEVLF